MSTNTRRIILTPVTSSIDPYCEAALHALEQRGYLVRRVLGHSAIDFGRCVMASESLRDGFEELMWIDSDVAFRPEDVERLRAMQVPIACGIYPKKSKPEFACEFLPCSKQIVFGKDGGVHEILYAGFGFVHTRREDPDLHLGYGNNIPLHLADNTLTTQGLVPMDDALPNSTRYYSTLTINWQVSPDGGITWVTPATATSANQTFVTLAAPIGGSIPLTVLFVGTEGSGGGNGATDNASLLSMIWSSFTGLSVTSAEGEPLKYWGGWDTQNMTTIALIQNHNGQCYSWASLFIDCLNAWGDGDVSNQNKALISTNTITTFGVTPNLAPIGGSMPNLFLVGNWGFGEDNIPLNNVGILQGWKNFAVIPTNPNIPPTQVQWVGQINGQPGYLWSDGIGSFAPNTPTPAQNNANPKADFQNHMVVSINGILYDPSYGVTYSSKEEFAALLGSLMTVIPFNNNLYNFDLNGTGTNNTTSYWVVLFKPITASMLVMN